MPPKKSTTNDNSKEVKEKVIKPRKSRSRKQLGKKAKTQTQGKKGKDKDKAMSGIIDHSPYLNLHSDPNYLSGPGLGVGYGDNGLVSPESYIHDPNSFPIAGPSYSNPNYPISPIYGGKANGNGYNDVTVPLPQSSNQYYPYQGQPIHTYPTHPSDQHQPYPGSQSQLHHHPSLPSLRNPHQPNNPIKEGINNRSNSNPITTHPKPQINLGFLPPGYPAPAILGKAKPKPADGRGQAPPEGFGWEDGRFTGGEEDEDDEEKGENGEVSCGTVLELLLIQ